MEMAELTMSLRLDEEAARALELLMRDGKSRSQVIRDALVDAARTHMYALAAVDAARVAADDDDRREIADVQAFMEALRQDGD